MGVGSIEVVAVRVVVGHDMSQRDIKETAEPSILLRLCVNVPL